MRILKGKDEDNGCGFWIIAKLLPDLEFKDICNRHDRMTRIGGGFIMYLITNLGFYVELLTRIKSKHRPWYETFLMFCYTTFMGVYVLLFNWLFFNWKL